MRKSLMLLMLGLASMSLTAAAIADPGDHGKSKAEHHQYTYTLTTTDGSSCGVAQPWANDVIVRTFLVKRNDDGTYRLTSRDRGTFTTLGTLSPGKCDPTGKHGSTVPAGIKGKLEGYFVRTVSGGTFNPNAPCTGDCGDSKVFVAAYFGPAATVSCGASCKYNFEYTAAHHQKLKYRHWQDKGDATNEEFHGDIATA